MVRLPGENKRPGICYATTRDGIELPAVDITHPAFALDIDEARPRELVEKFRRDGIPFSRLPSPLRNLLLRFLLRGSILAGGIRKAQGGFMTGIHTYLLKLGPLMAEALLPHLQADPRRPVVFLNIAGGPAVDSLNALIVLNKRHAGMLTGRRISIVVLDADDEGPAFGDAALAALSGTEGPLRGVDVNFQHRAYDWANADQLEVPLREALSQGALVICSSEGGLFEYGSDDEIVANLGVLRAHSSVVAVVDR